MSSSERRDRQRVPAKFEVNFIHKGDYLISFSENISVDGIFLYTENPPKLGETTKLQFSVGDLKNEIVLAKVMWVNHAETSDDKGVGLLFVNPSEDLRETILKIVNRVALFDEENL
ncbi:MAG: PilZ domain-containing protein [Proteobacteria bacterium]|nr:PilZ domain-containing protein [Pseudomonadota bacterium]MBU1709194.1 PilZ domain-containing protein [Pseudomonadota bacterium]